MKSIRILLCAICLLTISVASAQNGAVVIRGDILIAWADWNGGSVVAVQSSESDLFCNAEPGEIILTDWLAVFRPDGTIKYQERGAYFTRVFYPMTPDVFWSDPCAFWNDGPLVAEGITRSTLNSNDWDAAHPNRRSSWGYNAVGTLYDYAGFCDGGMVELNTVRRWLLEKDYPACLPDCIFKEVRKGPRLNCPD